MPLDRENGLIDLTHGSGGKNSYLLIQEVFADVFQTPALLDKNNSIQKQEGELILSTDGFVVSPLFFAGGDIGSLSLHGTINDLAMSGARPICITLGFIIEEGFPIKDLIKISKSMKKVLEQTGIRIQGGDTKVVEKGKGDQVFITTTGLGVLPPNREKLSLQKIKPNDHILISGTLGDHGIAILSQRANLQFETQIQSDSAPLHEITENILSKFNGSIKYLQDPTRGGLSGCLNEITHQTKLSIELSAESLPILTEVRGACELLGLDPLNLANEGKFIIICDPKISEDVLLELRKHPLGKNAAHIGQVTNSNTPKVILKTAYGGQKILNWLSGDQLPRIC